MQCSETLKMVTGLGNISVFFAQTLPKLLFVLTSCVQYAKPGELSQYSDVGYVWTPDE
jgi:hypothetical protein